ncbi:MAG: glycosyltransferase [Cyanobacteria bacterium P01_D01_bin.156]
MNAPLPPIYFYIPPSFWPDDLPHTSDENWAGFGLGIYAWTVQTYLKLQDRGVDCQLTNQLPEEGIIFFHANAARGAKIFPSSQRLLICLKAESVVCAQAQLHVVQNPCEVGQGCHFIPHWPQPGLKPRPPQNRFKTISFLGHRHSLAPELLAPDWQTQLEKRGLQWRPVINTNRWNDAQSVDTRWNDYQTIDAIVAIRQFNLKRSGYGRKPATKLYNAWLAGVPAILGRELAYRAEGTVGVDYLEANSMAELLTYIDQLQQNLELRKALIEAGYKRSQYYTSAAITQRWQQFLDNVAIPAYHRWRECHPWQRQVQQWQARLLNYRDRTRRKLSIRASAPIKSVDRNGQTS